FPAEFLALPVGLWLSTRLSSTAFALLPAAVCVFAFVLALIGPQIPQTLEARTGLAELRALSRSGSIRALAALEACTGALRWGLLGWSAQFLSEVHHIRPGDPNFGTAFAAVAAGALAGPVLCGVISDKLFNGRRAPAALAFFLAQAAVLAALGRATDPVHAIACLGLASAAAFGVHALLCGAAAMDAGGRRSAATVSGALDAFHHAAGGLAVLLVGIFVNRQGWGAWTATLIPFSLAGALMTFALRTEARDPSL
ncbi:MAG: MFS transporter, partial [Elusimicrobiota bacterium]